MAMAGIPREKIFRYSTAPSISSSLVFSISSIWRANRLQARHTTTPKMVQMMNAEWMVFSVSSSLPIPSARATATLTPAPMPMRNPANSVTSVDVEPTEPSA